MNYYTKQSLLSSIHKSTKLIDLSSDHASTIISEYGGRLLGLFPKKNCYNLLWTTSNIQETIETNNWAIGGERYWISPEREYFYKNPESWDGWFCPSTLDPANYEILFSSDTSCTVSSAISVVNQIKKEHYQGEITRQFKLIEDPIQSGAEFCGIEIIDDCVLFKPNLKLNGWSLTCVISGGTNNPGTVLIPTKPNPKPLSYFRLIPDDRMIIGENHVSFKIDVNDIYKLAIRPEDVNFTRKAKIGYFLKIPDSNEYSFLVKISDDTPKSQEECFDISRDHPESEIGIIQSYNSESSALSHLSFGEIELQLKLFETIDNTSHGKAVHKLIGYVGSKEDILDIVEKCLGISNPNIF
ncbi:MAG: DUF6786 family protein [Candidatus Hermodarchaeota archaeon]